MHLHSGAFCLESVIRKTDCYGSVDIKSEINGSLGKRLFYSTIQSLSLAIMSYRWFLSFVSVISSTLFVCGQSADTISLGDVYLMRHQDLEVNIDSMAHKVIVVENVGDCDSVFAKTNIPYSIQRRSDKIYYSLTLHGRAVGGVRMAFQCSCILSPDDIRTSDALFYNKVYQFGIENLSDTLLVEHDMRIMFQMSSQESLELSFYKGDELVESKSYLASCLPIGDVPIVELNSDVEYDRITFTGRNRSGSVYLKFSEVQ